MARVRNIVIVLLLSAALVYLGLKGYIYYQVKTSLDDAIATAGPMAEITYDGIYSSLTGSVTVRDIVVRAFGDEVRLGAARVGTPNVLVLLSALSELQRGEAPEFIELELNDLSVALSGPLMSFAQTALQSKAPRLPASYPCGGQVAFGPQAWRAMGYERLSNDVRLRIDLDKAGRSARLHSTWSTADMGAVRFEMELAGIAPSVDRLPHAGQAMLRWFELDYTDQSYYKRWVRYCAKRDKTQPNAFIASVMAADATYYMYSWGVVPGSDLRRGFGEFLRAPHSVSVVARPSTPVELDLLAHYSPDDLVALLDLRVIVNGHGVASSQVTYQPELLGKYAAAPSNKLQWPPPQPPRAQPKEPSQAQAQPQRQAKAPVQAQPKSAPPERQDAQRQDQTTTATAPVRRTETPSAARPQQPQTREYGFRRVAREGLDRYVGRYVRVLTEDGNAREGVLSDVHGTDVIVERRMHGGSLAVPVPMSTIARVEVWLPRDS